MALRFTLRQLEYLVAVGEAGSIAAASERVSVSSPSISAAISQLEAAFGVQLFVRHHAQGLSLTPGGQRIFDEARRILDGAASLTALANEIVDRPSGPIAIGCLVTIAPLVGAAIRRSFERECPEAAVTLRDAHQAELLAMLARARIDVALTYDLDIPADVAFEGLLRLPPQVMLAADHPLAACDAIALEELAAEPMVLLDLPHSREYFLSMFHGRGLRPRIAERSAELAVVRSLVANGYGYALINVRTPTGRAPDGRGLAFVALAGEHRPMVLGLATRRSEYRSRVVEAFEAHVRRRASDGDLPGIARPDGTPADGG